MPGPISTFTLQSTPSSNLKPSLAVADRALRFDFGGPFLVISDSEHRASGKSISAS
jgi:hypothetical protein